MIFAHQKFKHCFVACCASLLGKNDIPSQEEIVNQFPVDLQKGTEDEGVPQTTKEVNNVLKGLSISQNPQYIASTTSSFSPLSDALKANKQIQGRVLMLTRHPTNHCIGIKEIHDDKIIVMNPEEGDFTPMTYEEFEASKPTLLLLPP